MINNKKKDNEKIAVYQAFMNVPIPACITRVRDGKFIAVNEAGAKISGAKREEMIGRNTLDLGYVSQGQRKLLMKEIKENGFARNFPVTFNIKNEKFQALITTFKLKLGRENFLVNLIYAILNQKNNTTSFEKDLFYKIALLDLKVIKDSLKPYKLTLRQAETTVLSASGKSNKNIAKKLCISEHTVKDHLKEAFKVIGVKNRSELIPKLLNLN